MHAPPGSYPGYFQEVFERGLRQASGHRNPFVQHLLLGYYLEADAPQYIRAGRRIDIDRVQGTLLDVPDLGRFDLVSLSNIFDWMAPGAVEGLVRRMKADLRSGAIVMYRQLNNDRDIEALFGEEFEFDHALGRELWRADRSLFYSSVHVGIRR